MRRTEFTHQTDSGNVKGRRKHSDGQYWKYYCDVTMQDIFMNLIKDFLEMILTRNDDDSDSTLFMP